MIQMKSFRFAPNAIGYWLFIAFHFFFFFQLFSTRLMLILSIKYIFFFLFTIHHIYYLPLNDDYTIIPKCTTTLDLYTWYAFVLYGNDISAGSLKLFIFYLNFCSLMVTPNTIIPYSLLSRTCKSVLCN